MDLRRLSLLVLLVGPLAETAEAREHNRIVDRIRRQAVVTVVGDDRAVASVTASVRSDAGDEQLTLVESDAWLHGAAAIDVLPSDASSAELTLYDTSNTAIATYELGRLADLYRSPGDVELAVGASTDCLSRTGCTDTPDLAVRAEVFDAPGGYDVAFDLTGADVYGVAYATVTVAEGICLATDERGNCLKWGAGASTSAEVGWDEVGAVWAADAALVHTGVVELKVKARDARGGVTESYHTQLGAPWRDDGEGVSVLATDGDPLTRLVVVPRCTTYCVSVQNQPRTEGIYLMVQSEGWSADTLPSVAEVELHHGETLTIPVNSYQRTSKPKKYWSVYCAREYSWSGFVPLAGTGRASGDGVLFENLSPAELLSPVCSEGTCVTLTENEDGTCGLSATAYSADGAALPGSVDLLVSISDARAEKVLSESVSFDLEDAVTALFATEVGFREDPIGLDLAGSVTLFGASSRATLARGDFFGTLTRDGDGDLALGGSHGGNGATHGDILIGGEPVYLSDREGTLLPPPAIQYGNGSGTKNATTTTSARPELF